MASLNLQQVIGNLGRDGELKYLTDGTPVVNFTIASNEQWVDKEGNKQERVTWFNCSLFGKIGEALIEYLKKGKLVYVSGKTDNYDYEKPEYPGVKFYGSRVKVDKIQLLGGGGERQEGAPVDGKTFKTAAEAAAARAQALGGARPPASAPASAHVAQQKKSLQERADAGEFNDDDIPF